MGMGRKSRKEPPTEAHLWAVISWLGGQDTVRLRMALKGTLLATCSHRTVTAKGGNGERLVEQVFS